MNAYSYNRRRLAAIRLAVIAALGPALPLGTGFFTRGRQLSRAVRKCDSPGSWEKFWANHNPVKMEAIRMTGKRISFEAFEEIADQTR